MSFVGKVKKLLRELKKVFVDYKRKKTGKGGSIPYINDGRPVALMLSFNSWKSFLDDFLPEYKLVYIKRKDSVSKRYKKIVSKYKPHVFFVWGYQENEGLEKCAADSNIPWVRVEDGFLRSISLGSERSRPLSLCFDRRGLYFNSRSESDLEYILQNHDFSSDERLLSEAKEGLRLLLELSLSKYNNVKARDVSLIYGFKTKKRILVIGQVEDDASIKYGCELMMTNNDLVAQVIIENPDSEIIYKPHPDVLFNKRKSLSDISVYKDKVMIVTEPISLPDSFNTIDHVYTITSLAGFEALLRGIKVTTFGCPFYSGWGLTDDRQKCDRRTRKLTLLELFAGSYILYPKYYSLTDGKLISFREALMELSIQRQL